jgi:hypothetical protein
MTKLQSWRGMSAGGEIPPSPTSDANADANAAAT